MKKRNNSGSEGVGAAGSVSKKPTSLSLLLAFAHGTNSVAAATINHREAQFFSGTGGSSQVAEHHLELDVAIVDRAAIGAADGEKAYVERVLVGADLGHAGDLACDRQSQQLRDLVRCQHQLEYAALCRVLARAAVLAQQAQDDREPCAQRLERRQPFGQVAATAVGIAVQPEVVGGQVELADAAGNDAALLDRHQPFVVAQVLANLAGLRVQAAADFLDFLEQHVERMRLDVRIFAQWLQ